jgi:hypothetical protein
MKPYPLHVLILALLIIPGIALFFLEYFSDYKGGWIFSKYTLTKLYWLAYIVYAIGSTFIVTFIHLFLIVIKRRFTKLAVFLSHVIPIAVVWMSISFGIHDFIQDNWNRWTNPKGSDLSDRAPKKPKQRPPITQTPLSKRLPQQPPDTQTEQPKPMTTKNPD